MTNGIADRELTAHAGRLSFTSPIRPPGRLAARRIDARPGARITTPGREEALRGDQR